MASVLRHWNVYKIAGRRKLVGVVFAASAEDAIDQAVKEFGLPAADKKRLYAEEL